MYFPVQHSVYYSPSEDQVLKLINVLNGFFLFRDFVYSLLTRGPNTDILIFWENVFLEILLYLSPGLTPINISEVTFHQVDFFQLFLHRSTAVIQHVFSSLGCKPETHSAVSLARIHQSVLQSLNPTC